MILRPYQKVAVADASRALDSHKNTLVVAPTGAGKTIMLSALVGERFKKDNRVLIIQHRDELVNQNRSKFAAINPNISTSIVNGSTKNWNGETIFSMIQTVSRGTNLRQRPKFDMVIIDESHHAAADTYQKVIEAVREDNEHVEIVGFTATPNRGDGKALRSTFTNCSHQIEITTLIREGFLVRPKAFVIDVGVREALEGVTRRANDFDMAEVEQIMNKRVINERVVAEWIEKAGDRKTVVFCSTVKHAEDLLIVFVENQINAAMVVGETPKEERKQILHDLEFGETQVVINVAVLTEGFDAPPVSCIVLTRPSSYKSTMVQMIGRGLRIIDPEIYPDIVKTDCMVLDFGTSILKHGALDEAANLDGKDKQEGEAPEKKCPKCGFINPLSVKECVECGHVFESEVDRLINFTMTEYDLMELSPFLWMDIFGNGSCMMASGFEGFGVVGTIGNMSIGMVKSKNNRKVRSVAIGEKIQAMSAADDFMREIESSSAANKSKLWLNQRASDKQRNLLLQYGVEVKAFDFSWTKYKAMCWLNYLWNKPQIDAAVERIAE
jgi:DNA repair protein RadD